MAAIDGFRRMGAVCAAFALVTYFAACGAVVPAQGAEPATLRRLLDQAVDACGPDAIRLVPVDAAEDTVCCYFQSGTRGYLGCLTAAGQFAHSGQELQTIGQAKVERVAPGSFGPVGQLPDASVD